ncbi:MAG: hypothetical protein J6T10_03440 [Methanobrevibacter sp.]|nr:hypothetical protein [Methanobrevibacter sp.]
MKAIYLDIDGVLNYAECKSHCGKYLGIDNKKVKLLKHIVDATGAKIILSSDWKDFFVLHKKAKYQPYHQGKYLVRKLGKQGLYIEDIIPRKFEWQDRGLAILEHIKENNIEDYVILDDRFFRGFNDPPLNLHFIKTFDFHGEKFGGLTEKLVPIAIDILNGGKQGIYVDPDLAKYYEMENPINKEDIKELAWKR